MTGAGMAYMRARDAAMKDGGMYANMHVLGLFMQANAYDIETSTRSTITVVDNERVASVEARSALTEDEVVTIGAAMALAADATVTAVPAMASADRRMKPGTWVTPGDGFGAWTAGLHVHSADQRSV